MTTGVTAERTGPQPSDAPAPQVPGEPPGLRRELGRLDTVLFLVSAMVVVDTIGVVASEGVQAFTWLVLLALTFFVPSALATAELGAALPHEGGAYVWVREALGRRPAALASLLYWAGTPVWVGGSLVVVALAVVDACVVPLDGGARLALGVVLVVLATAGGVVPLRWGKWIPSSGAVVQVLLLAFFTATALAYGARHGVRLPDVSAATPTAAGFFTVAPVLYYSFVGIELPSAAAGEMRDPRRDVPVAVLRAGIVQAVLYGLPVLAVLAVVPAHRLTSLGGFVDALRTVVSVYGGTVAADGTVTLTGAGAVAGRLAALALVWVLVTSGTTWMMGGARTQAVACGEGGGPAVLARISPRTGVPVTMTVVTGLSALAVLVAGLAGTGADVQRYFTVTLVGAIAFDALAFLLIYPSFLVLRRRRPELDRPFRVPGGTAVATVVTVAATAWSLVVPACLLWPGLGTAHPDALLPSGFEGARTQFEVLVALPVLVVVTAFAAHWAHDAARSRRADAGTGATSR